jgi:hypothetical protein
VRLPLSQWGEQSFPPTGIKHLFLLLGNKNKNGTKQRVEKSQTEKQKRNKMLATLTKYIYMSSKLK